MFDSKFLTISAGALLLLSMFFSPVFAQAITPPDPIIDLIAIPGNGEIRLSWTAPDDNGSPITSYKVIRWVTGSDVFTTFPNLSTTTASILTGLQNGVSYSFKVYAVNSVGISTDSNIVTATPSADKPLKDVPDQIKDLQVVRGDSKVTLFWTKPNDNGSPITGYRITYWQVGTDSFNKKTVGADSTTAQITGLINEVPYAFKINTINEIGSSPDSNIDSATPSRSTVATVPNQVRAVIAIPSNGQVFLSWAEPSDNGAPITDYRIIVSEKGTNVFTTYPNLGDSTKTTISGLRNNVVYEFKVAAVNSIGIGKESKPITATPNDRVPIPITNLRATPGDGKVTLTWTVPSSALDTITSYRVREYQEGTNSFISHSILGKATTATIDGLTNGKPYGFSVVAVNADGIGPDSNTVYATPLPQPKISNKTPSAVINLKAVAADGQVTLLWTAPSDNGSPITGYNIIRSIADSSSFSTIIKSTTTTTEIIKGLQNGITYNFRISAINSAGAGPESNTVSAIPTGQSTNLAIPYWIKNNAKWWADGLISDSEYVKAIEWLINQGIIKIK